MIAEAARVLRPGGRIAVSDVVAAVDDAARASVDQWTGCVASALAADQCTELLARARLIDIEIVEGHRIDGHAVAGIVRARKPDDQGK